MVVLERAHLCRGPGTLLQQTLNPWDVSPLLSRLEGHSQHRHLDMNAALRETFAEEAQVTPRTLLGQVASMSSAGYARASSPRNIMK